MKALLKKLRDRKGITMTEVVVAMTVVIIITGAAISVVTASVQFDAKYQQETYDLNACESAVNCVRFADSPAELETLLVDKLEFTEETQGVYTFGDTVMVTTDGNWKVIFDGNTIYEKK